MDMSKLPRMSDTQRQQQAHAAAVAQPPPPPGTAQPAPVMYKPVQAEGAGPEAWFSIAIGVIVLLLNGRFWQYFVARSSFTWTFNDAQGNPLAYTQTVFFWGDLAMVAYGIVLIVDGLVLAFARRPAALLAALTLTIVATLLNLGYLVAMMSMNFGLQLMPALAVAFGVYIAMSQWRMLQMVRAGRA